MGGGQPACVRGPLAVRRSAGAPPARMQGAPAPARHAGPARGDAQGAGRGEGQAHVGGHPQGRALHRQVRHEPQGSPEHRQRRVQRAAAATLPAGGSAARHADVPGGEGFLTQARASTKRLSTGLLDVRLCLQYAYVFNQPVDTNAYPTYLNVSTGPRRCGGTRRRSHGTRPLFLAAPAPGLRKHYADSGTAAARRQSQASSPSAPAVDGRGAGWAPAPAMPPRYGKVLCCARMVPSWSRRWSSSPWT